MKKFLLCSRRAAILCFALPTVILFACICASEVIPFIRHSNAPLSHELAGIGFLVLICLDLRARNFGRSLSYAFGYGASLVAILAFILVLPTVEYYSHRTAFDSAEWKSSLTQSPARGEYPIRLSMVHDLLQRYRLQGMSRQQIDQLLGKPPASPDDGDNYVYWLGPELGFGVDSELLCIKFKDSVVTEVRIRTD